VTGSELTGSLEGECALAIYNCKFVALTFYSNSTRLIGLLLLLSLGQLSAKAVRDRFCFKRAAGRNRDDAEQLLQSADTSRFGPSS